MLGAFLLNEHKLAYQRKPRLHAVRVCSHHNLGEFTLHIAQVVPKINDGRCRSAPSPVRGRALTVSEVSALTDLDDVPIRVADVAANLAVSWGLAQ